MSNPEQAPAGKPSGPPAGEIPAAGGQGGFDSLFNGKDLAGWKTHPNWPGNSRVADGVLIGSGRAGDLYTVGGDYKDFHLRVEARVNRGGNSGVHFRIPFGGDWARAYGVQISPDKTLGCLNVRDRELRGPADPRVPALEWFVLEVIADGNQVVTKVNGKTISELLDPVDHSAGGHLSLELPNAPTAVEFRKIEIKKLPPRLAGGTGGSPKGAPKPATAPAVEPPAPPAGPRANEVRYEVFDEKLTWLEAKARCEKLGGHLAIVRNEAENRRIHELVAARGLKSLWLGASNAREEGHWVWVDGTEMTYQAWEGGVGQPNDSGYFGESEAYLIMMSDRGGVWWDISRRIRT